MHGSIIQSPGLLCLWKLMAIFGWLCHIPQSETPSSLASPWSLTPLPTLTLSCIIFEKLKAIQREFPHITSFAPSAFQGIFISPLCLSNTKVHSLQGQTIFPQTLRPFISLAPLWPSILSLMSPLHTTLLLHLPKSSLPFKKMPSSVVALQLHVLLFPGESAEIRKNFLASSTSEGQWSLWLWALFFGSVLKTKQHILTVGIELFGPWKM